MAIKISDDGTALPAQRTPPTPALAEGDDLFARGSALGSGCKGELRFSFHGRGHGRGRCRGEARLPMLAVRHRASPRPLALLAAIPPDPSSFFGIAAAREGRSQAAAAR